MNNHLLLLRQHDIGTIGTLSACGCRTHIEGHRFRVDHLRPPDMGRRGHDRAISSRVPIVDHFFALLLPILILLLRSHDYFLLHDCLLLRASMHGCLIG